MKVECVNCNVEIKRLKDTNRYEGDEGYPIFVCDECAFEYTTDGTIKIQDPESVGKNG